MIAPSESAIDELELTRLDAYWRAANYLSAGQIYLLDNPLLTQPLRLEHIKPRPLGHWGTSPGLNFIYAHMNRMIRRHGLSAIFIAGSGHGGPAVVANAYLEGTYTERFPAITMDERGMRKLFRQFSFPGGIPSHASPHAPGSIHEGGELGYSLSHAYGAVFDNPDLIACCVVGDGEAETGPLATSWHGNKFLNPARDGAVLPILHLNGYKISGPTVLARIESDELRSLFEGYGYSPIVVAGSEPALMHKAMSAALERAILRIRQIQRIARARGFITRFLWPLIVLRTPKGWTGPACVDGVRIENTFRSHQLPVSGFQEHPEHIGVLEQWMRSYRQEELFDSSGAPLPEIRDQAPAGAARMSDNPHANGGLLLRDLALPPIEAYAAGVRGPGSIDESTMHCAGEYLRDIMHNNPHTFRLFSPDETASNRLEPVFSVTTRCSTARTFVYDDRVSPDGRVMEMLSEHTCQGWNEGYVLTGRHGVFSTYEAFVHITDSMFNQHAKWLEVSRTIPWRAPVASLNYLITSHVWRQDNNGFTHQDPGFLDVAINKSPDVVRIYLPPDANTGLVVLERALRSRNQINVIVGGKHAEMQWLELEAARAHCEQGIGIWSWASNDEGHMPDVVMACAGDVPTLETLAAVDLLRTLVPQLRVRVVNVVDLLALQELGWLEFDSIFTTSVPVIFAFHGYPALVHRLTYRRTGHDNFHVHGYRETGTTTTPFDMTVLNQLDRFHLAIDALERVVRLRDRTGHITQRFRDRLLAHRAYIEANGTDMPEIASWRWPEVEVRS